VLLAIGGLSGGSLAFEIGLTRLLSAMLVSDWVAPVLAAALLGLGLGAAAASGWHALRSETSAGVAAALAPLAAAASVPVFVAAGAAGRPLLGLALPVVTYALIGLAVAATFARFAQHAPYLYRADLGAAAIAAAATPLALGALGGLQGSLAAALMLAVGAIGLVPPGRRALALAGAALTAGAFAAGAGGLVRLDPAALAAAKPIRAALERGGVIEATRWDATARTDLVRTPDGARYLYMDGGAGSLVPDPDPNRWWRDVGAYAFAVSPADSAYLIGSGGGLDVAQARAHGVRDVTAVEVNRASVELVRELGDAAGHVYEPPTTVVIGDGRRELARLPAPVDVITLANVVTQAAELRGAALTENRVYTLEAFDAYLRALAPGGRLTLTLYDEATLTRALTTALEALVRGGWAVDHAAATRHLIAVMDAAGARSVPLLEVRPVPFTFDEAVAAARVAEARGWSLLLVPHLLAPPALQPLVDGDASLQDVIDASPAVDLRPTIDDRPYFFAFTPGVPPDVRRAGWLALAVLAALVAAAPLVGRATGGHTGTRPAARRWLAAVTLGAAFLALELHALQVVQRGVGHPAWSLALTLGAVLLGGAVGAGIAARRGGSSVRRTAAVAALAVAAWTLLGPPAASALEPLSPLAAGAVLGVMLGLVGVPMGMPFPRLLSDWSLPRGVAAAWAASGLAAVAAGAAALWLGHAIGTPAVGTAAALAYAAAALAHPARARA
jgi:hypothetical protein